MKLKYNVYLVILAFLIIILLSGCKNKTKKLHRIYTKDNRFYVKGKPFILRGVSIGDPYFLDLEDEHFEEKTFSELVNWNINVVRIPIHPGAWQAEKDFTGKYLDKIIEWSIKYGFYIILDWHAIGNPLTGEPQAADWKLDGYPVYDSRLELAEEAWMILAEKYGKYENVIFELFNEPVAIGGGDASWQEWRDKLLFMISKIRQKAPDTLVLVSGWQWTLDLSGFAMYPLNTENTGFVTHVYPQHSGWDKYFGFLSKKYPIIVTEWGFSSTVDQNQVYYGNREVFGQNFLKYIEDRNLSWTAWCFHPKWYPNLVSDWDYTPTDSGKLILQTLMKDNKNPSLQINSPVNGESVKGLVEITGDADDEIGILNVEVKVGDESYKAVKYEYNPDYTSTKWIYKWNSLKSENGSYKITARVTDTSGNISTSGLKLKVENNVEKDPPSIKINQPLKSSLLSGNVAIVCSIKDESGLEEVKLYIDEEIIINNYNTNMLLLKHWFESPELTTKKDNLGMFSDIFYKDGKLNANFDSTNVTNGDHNIIVKATDVFGNIKEEKIPVKVENGNLIDDCEKSTNWYIYDGGGSKITIAHDKGVSGKAIKALYDGDATGWWGVRKRNAHNYSDYTGVEFYLKGSSNRIRVQFTDAEHKLWVYQIIPTSNWKKYTIPFSDFKYRGDWQISGTPKNKNFKLDKVYEFQLIHTVDDQDADGELWLDDVKLY